MWFPKLDKKRVLKKGETSKIQDIHRKRVKKEKFSKKKSPKYVLKFAVNIKKS